MRCARIPRASLSCAMPSFSERCQRRGAASPQIRARPCMVRPTRARQPGAWVARRCSRRVSGELACLLQPAGPAPLNRRPPHPSAAQRAACARPLRYLELASQLAEQGARRGGVSRCDHALPRCGASGGARDRDAIERGGDSRERVTRARLRHSASQPAAPLLRAGAAGKAEIAGTGASRAASASLDRRQDRCRASACRDTLALAARQPSPAGGDPCSPAGSPRGVFSGGSSAAARSAPAQLRDQALAPAPAPHARHVCACRCWAKRGWRAEIVDGILVAGHQDHGSGRSIAPLLPFCPQSAAQDAPVHFAHVTTRRRQRRIPELPVRRHAQARTRRPAAAAHTQAEADASSAAGLIAAVAPSA